MKFIDSLPNDFGSVKAAIIATAILSFIDAVNTTIALGFRLTEELNPIMAWAWDRGVLVFWLVKLLLGAMPFLAFALPKQEDYSGFFLVALIPLALFMAIVMQQALGWAGLLFGQPL